MIVMVFLYFRKQYDYYESVCRLQLAHEKSILAARLEIQEQTLHHVSREIHDNISLSLTLAKSHLNTLNWEDPLSSYNKVHSSVTLIGESIHALSDISQSLNAELIIQDGLVNALKGEISRIREIGSFKVDFFVTGSPVFMATEKELIIFRLVQEAFNNIIKHARAGCARLLLHYDKNELEIKVSDNGVGFILSSRSGDRRAGLQNMECRIKMLGGKMTIRSVVNLGTVINYTLPIE
jgi:signal transduction histidine kinase